MQKPITRYRPTVKPPFETAPNLICPFLCSKISFHCFVSYSQRVYFLHFISVFSTFNRVTIMNFYSVSLSSILTWLQGWFSEFWFQFLASSLAIISVVQGLELEAIDCKKLQGLVKIKVRSKAFSISDFLSQWKLDNLK